MALDPLEVTELSRTITSTKEINIVQNVDAIHRKIILHMYVNRIPANH